MFFLFSLKFLTASFKEKYFIVLVFFLQKRAEEALKKTLKNLPRFKKHSNILQNVRMLVVVSISYVRYLAGLVTNSYLYFSRLNFHLRKKGCTFI